MKNSFGNLGQWAIPCLSLMILIGLVLLQNSEPIFRDMGESGPAGDIIGWKKPYENVSYWLIGIGGLGIIGLYLYPILRMRYKVNNN